MNVYNVKVNNEPEGQWIQLQPSEGLRTVMDPDEEAAFFAAHSHIAVERDPESSPKSSNAKLADLTCLGAFSFPVFSSKARTVFEPHLEGLGHWITLSFDEAPYWLFYLTAVRDVLDPELSQIARFKSGRVMAIDRPVFRAEALKGLFMWQVKELPQQYICVTDTAMDLVRQHGLTGFEFELLWSDKFGPLPEGLKNWERPRFSGLEIDPFDADVFWARSGRRAAQRRS